MSIGTESSTTDKLRQLARRLYGSDTRTLIGSPKRLHEAEYRLTQLYESIARHLHTTDDTYNTLKAEVMYNRQLLDNLRRYRESMQKLVQEAAHEKYYYLSSLYSLKNIDIETSLEQLTLEFKSRQLDIYDKAVEYQRSFQNQLVSLEKKSQRLLMNILNELNSYKKNRSKSMLALSYRLQDRVNQVICMIETEHKVQTETYKKIYNMQQYLTDRFKYDMSRAVRERKESGDQLLRMLEDACDSLLY